MGSRGGRPSRPASPSTWGPSRRAQTTRCGRVAAIARGEGLLRGRRDPAQRMQMNEHRRVAPNDNGVCGHSEVGREHRDGALRVANLEAQVGRIVRDDRIGVSTRSTPSSSPSPIGLERRWVAMPSHVRRLAMSRHPGPTASALLPVAAGQSKIVFVTV